MRRGVTIVMQSSETTGNNNNTTTNTHGSRAEAPLPSKNRQVATSKQPTATSQLKQVKRKWYESKPNDSKPFIAALH